MDPLPEIALSDLDALRLHNAQLQLSLVQERAQRALEQAMREYDRTLAQVCGPLLNGAALVDYDIDLAGKRLVAKA